MPGSYLIDETQQIVFSRAWGEVTNLDLVDHARTLRADPRFGPYFRQIVDFSDVTHVHVTSEGVRLLVHINPFERAARRAFVVASDVAFGMARMYQITLDPEPESLHICRNLGEGFVWLGLDPATPWPARTPDHLTQVG